MTQNKIKKKKRNFFSGIEEENTVKVKANITMTISATSTWTVFDLI